jgi:uncharacterized membrane protein
MNKNRLEAFSDGVLAIIITIMVLELHRPDGTDWHALRGLGHVLVSYVMSFLFVGVYWGNHHHLLHLVRRVSPAVMLANLNLLFWLSLVPFATGWMGESKFEPFTVAVYASLLNVCGISYTILQEAIARRQRDDLSLRLVMRKHRQKGFVSLACYTAATPLSYLRPATAVTIFFAVAFYWLIPDLNIERLFDEPERQATTR